MEFQNPNKKEFLSSFQRYEPTVLDSSAITTFKKCARLYFYQYVLARVLSDSQPYIYFGSAYHKFRETLSRLWLGHNLKGGTIHDFPDDSLLVAIKDAIKCYDEGGSEPRAGTRYDFLTKARLIASCNVAYQLWKEEQKHGNKKVIDVEIPINFEYANGNRKSGRIDEIIEINGRLWIRDFKTSATRPEYYRNQIKLKDQAATYLLGIERLSGKRVDGLYYEQMWNDKPTQKEQKGPEIHTHIVQLTPSWLERWEKDQAIVHNWIDEAREMDSYPMTENEMACPRCPFWEVCLANNENMMTALLKSKYKLHVWNNMDPDNKEKTE